MARRPNDQSEEQRHLVLDGGMGPKKLENVKKTTKCEKGFACLSHEIDCVCSVEDYRDHMILFVKAPPDNECMYKMPLGESSFCVCPMRAELYQQYGV